MQVFTTEVADEGIQATPTTQTTSIQTVATLENTLANLLRGDDDEDTLRNKIDALAEGLGFQRDLIDELLRKSKLTESSVMSESAVIRKHGPPPPYEPTSTPSWQWPKFLTVMQNGDVLNTGLVTFALWSSILFLLGLTMKDVFLPKHDLSGLYPTPLYVSTFEMFQRHWWEKWGMSTPWGRMIWRIGWWMDEMLRGDGVWPS